LVNLVAAVVLGLTVGAVIAAQLLRRGPPVWLIFLVGGFAMVATSALSVGGATGAIADNLPVFVFLIALFLFVAGLQQAGALEHLAAWVVGRARTPEDLPFVLFVAIGFLSAFILNDALVLVGVPLLLSLARRLRLPPEPLLLTLAFSVTVGSVPTPFGNPQNLLVSLDSGLSAPVATFLRYLLLPTVVNLLVGGLLVRRAFRGPLRTVAAPGSSERPAARPFFPTRPLGSVVRTAPVLALFPMTMAAMVSLSVTSDLVAGPSVPLDAVALGGALAMLVATPGRAALFGRVDWTILALFAGLFVVVAGAVNGGVFTALTAVVPTPGPAHPASAIATILAESVGGSQVVSNVPWVGLQIPILHAAGYGPGTAWAWAALAGGSTLAGNLTVLGAASNIIIVEQAERAGARVSLRAFVRVGLPMTLLTVGVLFAFLLVGL
jgi:Na+/H+ antiporter NhaD/arsenite permease-like protein